jgi:two-component system cell cycle response regulator CpdR
MVGAELLQVPTVARKVLVVDDDPLVLNVIAGMLEELGCDVVMTTNPRLALDLLATDERLEVLITDINMPEMNGYELAEKARRAREELKVIVLSGRETDGRGLPMIQKPFLQEDLARVMEHTTGRC